MVSSRVRLAKRYVKYLTKKFLKKIGISDYIKINEAHRNQLSGQNTSTSNGSDSSFGSLGEELGLDDNRDVGESSATQDLLESSLGDVDDSGLALVGRELAAGFLGEEGPETIEVDGFAVDSVLVQSEDADATLAVETGVVAEHVNSLVVLTSAVTATSGMLSVLADSSVTVGDVSSQLSGLFQSGWH